MAICPFATYKPVSRDLVPMYGYYRINNHQAVTDARSLFSFANRRGNPFFHFYINEFGEIEQYVDTRYRAAADLDGNDVTLSIEAWDNKGKATQYNPAQLAALIRLHVWLLQTHPEIPCVLAVSSRPVLNKFTGVNENRGISWHRLGVPYRTTRALANLRIATKYREGWLQKGGVWYSKSSGKTCPGDGRIYQIKNELYPAVLEQINGGTVKPAPIPKPKPLPKPNERRPISPAAIKAGSVGALVFLLQQILKERGYYKGLVDRSFGPLTDRAVRRFQSDNKITVDGSVWRETWAHLLIAGGPLQRGATGYRVSLLQIFLGWHLGDKGNDKSFGPATETRVREVQRYLNISVDGSVWRETVKALAKAS